MSYISNKFLLLSLIVALSIATADGRVDVSLKLSLPVDCKLGENCWVVNLVDRDSGIGVQDFNCNSHSYDGHKGIDFAIRDFAAMDVGVQVLTAAPGTVKGVRNHMNDIDYRKLKDGVVTDLDCGNGVTIEHASNWETQYCHMRRGSVSVVPGQQVVTGDVLGYVGSSGRAAFPHLHLSVRHEGRVVDPFTTDIITANPPACGAGSDTAQLWDDSVLGQFPGTMTAVYNTGFAPSVPNREIVKAGQYTVTSLSASSAALVFWVEMFWTSDRDKIELKIIDPNGVVLVNNSPVPPRERATSFFYAGKKRPADKWPTGVYTGEVRMLRDNGDGSVTELRGVSSILVQ